MKTTTIALSVSAAIFTGTMANADYTGGVYEGSTFAPDLFEYALTPIPPDVPTNPGPRGCAVVYPPVGFTCVELPDGQIVIVPIIVKPPLEFEGIKPWDPSPLIGRNGLLDGPVVTIPGFSVFQ